MPTRARSTRPEGERPTRTESVASSFLRETRIAVRGSRDHISSIGDDGSRRVAQISILHARIWKPIERGPKRKKKPPRHAAASYDDDSGDGVSAEDGLMNVARR